MQHREAKGFRSFYQSSDVLQIRGLDTQTVEIEGMDRGQPLRIQSEIALAGCDGFHGICRKLIPNNRLKEYEKVYRFGRQGVLADVKPVAEELIYADSPEGFALCSMRSPSRSRYYVQVPVDDDIASWSDRAVLVSASLQARYRAAERTGDRTVH
jgi:p-hydroxybenzoate 3-monooxygenase